MSNQGMQTGRGFWDALPRPFVGLAPMDGVTNAPYRYITARHGRPAVSYTEFVPVEGITHAAVKLLADFAYDPIERPIVAQVYGHEPRAFYAVAHLVAELGFDGIDINMGCPAKNVANRGAGAGLIRTPSRAQEIVRAVRQGIYDWCAGQSPEAAGVPREIGEAARQWCPEAARPPTRHPIPISIKTRLGYDTDVSLDWVRTLLDVEPAAICLHGRTLRQMYRGAADWDAIAAAAELIHATSTLALGNGDIATPEQLRDRLAQTGVDGVLIGRGSMGNPWIFGAQGPVAMDTRLGVLCEHAARLERFNGGRAFPQIYRLIKPYTLGHPDAGALRARLMEAKSAVAVRAMCQAMCHPEERSDEGSGCCRKGEILRFAQDDKETGWGQPPMYKLMIS